MLATYVCREGESLMIRGEREGRGGEGERDGGKEGGREGEREREMEGETYIYLILSIADSEIVQ